MCLQAGRFSHLESERKAELRPILETANQVKEDFRQEASVPKVSSSLEQVTTRAEDLGAEFRQNVAFMRQTLPEAAVAQPTPVQPGAVPISAHQAEETPKVEVTLLLFVRAKFAELSAEIARVVDSADNTS